MTHDMTFVPKAEKKEDKKKEEYAIPSPTYSPRPAAFWNPSLSLVLFSGGAVQTLQR